MKNRLCKSVNDKMLADECGRIAEYLNLDPTLIRIAWVIFCAMGGAGIPAYVIAAIIMPEAGGVA